MQRQFTFNQAKEQTRNNTHKTKQKLELVWQGQQTNKTLSNEQLEQRRQAEEGEDKTANAQSTVQVIITWAEHSVRPDK